MLANLFPQIAFNRDLMEQRAAQGFSTVTELADLLVRERGISFRQAHQIIGRVVNELLDKSMGVRGLSSNMIDKAAQEVLGNNMNLPEEEVKKALDPSYNVAVREVEGGPSPGAVEILISHQEEELRQRKDWLSRCQRSLERAKKTCDKAQLQALSKN